MTSKGQTVFDNNIIFHNKKKLIKNELLLLIENRKKLLGHFFLSKREIYLFRKRFLGTKKLFFTVYKKKFIPQKFCRFIKKKKFLNDNIFSCPKGRF